MAREISDDVREKAKKDHVERKKEHYDTDSWEERYKQAVHGGQR